MSSQEEHPFPSLEQFLTQIEPDSQLPPVTDETSVNFPTIHADSLDDNKQLKLGELAAELYIASHNVCAVTMDTITRLCDAKAGSRGFKFGFNARMSQSVHRVRIK